MKHAERIEMQMDLLKIEAIEAIKNIAKNAGGIINLVDYGLELVPVWLETDYKDLEVIETVDSNGMVETNETLEAEDDNKIDLNNLPTGLIIRLLDTLEQL